MARFGNQRPHPSANQTSGLREKGARRRVAMRVDQLEIRPAAASGSTATAVKLTAGGAAPAASVTYDGQLWYAKGAAGVRPSQCLMCMLNTSGGYEWTVIGQSS